MFTLKCPRLVLTRIHRPALQRTHRTFVTSTVQTLADGVLDLAIALPYPPSLPPYTTTIIAVTVVTRLIFTLPFSIWAKKLQWKTEDIVLPRVRELGPQVAQTVRNEMTKERITGTKDKLKAIYHERFQKAMKIERKKILAQEKLSPTMIMALPFLTQLPVFVVTSLVFARTVQFPSVLDSESFWTLTSLVSPDPTGTIPIAIGLITLANVESSQWFITDAQRARQEKVEQWNEEKRAQGHLVLEPKKIVKNALRGLSVGRILISTMVPGAVEIYWLSSATFGLLQSWIFDWWEQRRFRPVEKPPTLKPPPSTPPTPKPLRLI